MQTSKSENRHLIIITLLLALLFTTFYVFYTPDNDRKKLLTFHQEKAQYTACDKVDIPWLAGDRIYWNGWDPKAMFMKADGTFTKGNVYIQEGDELCVVVLLGPTPAYSPQTETNHLGTTDSISLFAQGQHVKQTIQLEQHKAQTNAYFAAVKFHHADMYELVASEEYRSYFWEKPILHTYHPLDFLSENKLIVKQNLNKTTPPICQLNNSHTDLSGAWIDPSAIDESRRQDLYTMFEGSIQEFMENGKVFVPNNCLLGFKSNGYGIRCLGTKTIHVWGDNNLKRNLKAMNFNQGSWCDVAAISNIQDEDEQREAAKCICNDDHEDNSLYPWIQDPYTPINMDNSWGIQALIYYNRISKNLIQQMTDFVHNETLVKPADYVILGLGNDDIRALQVSPSQFKMSFTQTIQQIRQVYPHQTLIVRTPQYFCCGVIPTTSWNAGRSLTFTDIVRQTIEERNDNVLLWDTHLLGTNENTCLSEGSVYTKRNVINMENQILWSLICSTSNPVESE